MQVGEGEQEQEEGEEEEDEDHGSDDAEKNKYISMCTTNVDFLNNFLTCNNYM